MNFCSLVQNVSSFSSRVIYLFTCVVDNCGDDCASFTENLLDWSSPGLGRPVLFMCLQGLIFFALIMFGETGKLQLSWQNFLERTTGTFTLILLACTLDSSLSEEGLAYHALFMHKLGSTIDTDDEEEAIVWQRSIMTAQTHLAEDDDVALERHRINNTDQKELLQSDSLILKELRKFYGGFLAVDRISLGNDPLADPRGGDRNAPRGPNSFIFMQFSVKSFQNNSNLGVASPLGKSWIRHCDHNSIM